MVAAALGGVLRFDIFTHEDIDLDDSLVLPVLQEELPVVLEEFSIELVLMWLPVLLL